MGEPGAHRRRTLEELKWGGGGGGGASNKAALGDAADHPFALGSARRHCSLLYFNFRLLCGPHGSPTSCRIGFLMDQEMPDDKTLGGTGKRDLVFTRL